MLVVGFGFSFRLCIRRTTRMAINMTTTAAPPAMTTPIAVALEAVSETFTVSAADGLSSTISGRAEGSDGWPRAGTRGGGGVPDTWTGGDDGSGGWPGGGIGGPMIVGLTVKANAEESTPRLLARASGRLVCVLTAVWASAEEAEPSLTTVTEASTLSSVLVVLISELDTPRSFATAAESTVGAASETSDEALNVCVTVKLVVVCRRRPWTIIPLSTRRRAVLTSQSKLSAHTALEIAALS